MVGGVGKEGTAQSHLRICPVKEQEREGMSPTLLLHQTEEKPLVPGFRRMVKRGQDGKRLYVTYRVKGTNLMGMASEKKAG